MEAPAMAPFRDPSVWTASDLPPTRGWVRALTPAHLAEIHAAIRAAAHIPFHQITKSDFPLPLTAPLLQACAEDLEHGRGFSVLGKFPVQRYSYEDNLIAFAGLSAHLGRIVDQSYAGAMIVDVKDQGVAYDASTRGYNTTAPLLFHTDGAGLTGLMCLGVAEEGGLSVLASAGMVSNLILAERPDLHAILRAGFHHHRRGEHAPGEPPISDPIPVFEDRGGLLHCTYDRNQSIWAQQEGIKLTRRQLEALDYMDSILARPELQLHMHLQRGDIQFVNNYTMFHARTAYRNGPGAVRHLLRIWLDPVHSRWSGTTTRDLYVRREVA